MFGFVLFTDYMIDAQKQTAEISVNSKFSYLLNDLTKNFTRFEMLEFASLSSSYSKTAYKLLKQYQSTGKLILSTKDFREQFCVPKSYQMCNINKVILQPILNELPIYFKKLKIEKQANGKGKTITHIEFTFKAQDKMFANKEKVSHKDTSEMDELERRLIEKRETINRMYEKNSI
ncbi:MAG: replication initiation protein [Peptostreptococcaceae bacterium]|nr:replication initiation protein [Peptostreptococcaceae bacterium]